MPQMSPLWWTSIFVMMLLLLIIMMTTMKNTQLSLTKKQIMKSTENKMKW